MGDERVTRRAVAAVALLACVAALGCGAASNASRSQPANRPPITSQQRENVTALAQATALIRYRHPSDGAAKLDWDAFLPFAVDRVLRAADEDALQRALGELFANIAPTVEFSRLPAYSSPELPRRGGDHLARWRHAGLGPEPPYSSWREGRDADLARVLVDVPVELPHLSSCEKSQLRAVVHGRGDQGEVLVYARVDLAGAGSKQFDRAVARGESAISLDLDMPADAYRVRLGVELRGRAEIALESLALTCANRDRADIDVAKTSWSYLGFTDLYSHALEACGASSCLKLAHLPLDTTWLAARDVLDARITEHLWIHVPLAVWANQDRTFPETAAWTPVGTASETAVRLATVASAWATLSMFYPYFRDLKIDWPRELPPALEAVAAARSTIDTFHALGSLIAKIHDGHARAIHPDFPIDGILPVRLRRFGDKVIVVGVLPDHAARVPVGTEVLAIDHIPVLERYAEQSERVSSATAGWSAWTIPAFLTFGRLGTSATLRIRTADQEVDVSLPRVSRELNDSLVREPRPAFGAELAPGIRYIDLEAMKEEQWQATLPSLAHAPAIVLDMRGYPSRAVAHMLGHFIDEPIRSPEWQLPVLESGGYQNWFWTIQPKKPRLDARLVVLLDGRAMSAAETFLQIVHDHRLAVMVGESSAGTNGNVRVVALPGGFAVRFTGMRVPLADGTALHGRGIVPDEVVHPTLEGIRAGRDEVLEAAIGVARKLIAK